MSEMDRQILTAPPAIKPPVDPAELAHKDLRDDDDASTDEPETSGQPPSDWGPEQEYELRLGSEEVPPLTLAMSRDEVEELFGSRADEVLLMELDSTALLENTLEGALRIEQYKLQD